MKLPTNTPEELETAPSPLSSTLPRQAFPTLQLPVLVRLVSANPIVINILLCRFVQLCNRPNISFPYPLFGRWSSKIVPYPTSVWTLAFILRSASSKACEVLRWFDNTTNMSVHQIQ